MHYCSARTSSAAALLFRLFPVLCLFSCFTFPLSKVCLEPMFTPFGRRRMWNLRFHCWSVSRGYTRDVVSGRLQSPSVQSVKTSRFVVLNLPVCLLLLMHTYRSRFISTNLNLVRSEVQHCRYFSVLVFILYFKSSSSITERKL